MENKIITGQMGRPILYLVAVMLIVFYSCNQISSLDGLENNKSIVQAGDAQGQKSAVMFGGSALNSLAPDGYIKIWEDHFDGPSLNTDNWTIGLRDPESGHLVPGGAGDYLLNTSYDSYITEEDMYIVMNNGTRTQSPDTNTEWPNYLVLDYVKLYQLPTSMKVESVEAGTHHDGQGWRRGTATVSIRDNFGKCFGNFTVMFFAEKFDGLPVNRVAVHHNTVHIKDDSGVFVHRHMV